MKSKLIRIVLFLLLLCLFFAAGGGTAVARQAGQTIGENDSRFGIVEGYEDPEAADELGVGWTRVRFHWGEVQAGGPGTWTPPVSDQQINREIAGDRQVVGLLIGIPDWARGVNRLPRGLWLEHDDPRNTWGRYVREAVERYDGRIDHWVIWNEPDIEDPTALGHTWDGSIEDFVQLQRVAYLVAKETNPEVVIHLAAFTYFWDAGYFGRLLDVIAADPAAAAHNHYFDVATAHLYFQPDSIYTILQHFLGDLEAQGLEKPIWLVETNAPPLDDPAWPVREWTLSVTLSEQAAFMPQALASALAAGAERVAVYKLKDTADDRAANPEPFGLLRQNGRRRPAYTTYQVAIHYLSGAFAATRERWDAVGQIRLDQLEFSTTVLFARLPIPQQAQVRATADSGVLVDMWGERRPITAENGFFTIDLPPALCTQSIGDYCMIGGTTYYLVQAADNQPPPSPTPTALPTLTPSPTATAAPTTTPEPGLPTPVITPVNELTDDTGADGVESVAPVEQATVELAAVPAADDTSFPTGDEPSQESEGVLAYFFLGAAVLLAVGIAGWWRLSGRRH